MTKQCTYDSGSMTGCQPLCDKPATYVVIKRACGGYPELALPRCAKHVAATQNKLYPLHGRTMPLPTH